MSRRWKIVLVATLFNLLAEYSVRGINNLRVTPLLPPFLFLTYFAYFAMMEDLIGRYRLKDYHVYVASLFFGLLWQLIGPSVVFFPPTILGINWASLLFVNLVWWSSIQTILALYIANRITPRKDWDHPLLSRAGWGLAFLTYVGVTLALRLVVHFPPVMPLQVLIMGGLISIVAALFKRLVPGPEERSLPPAIFEKDRLLDLLSVLSAVLFFYLAVFLTSDPSYVVAAFLNRTALRANIVGSTIVGLLMLTRRLSSKKPIRV
jgi:hypothetical protein